MARRKNLATVDALFGGLEESADQLISTSTSINIENIKPNPDQPRKISDPPTPEQMKGLEELAESIRNEGVLQPVIVRPMGRNSYILVAGERRWRASAIAGLETIPAIVREFDENKARVVSLIENIQREDLNEDERADALVKLKDIEEITWKEVGERVGLSEARVKALARITRESETIRELVREGLSPGHLEVTRKVDNPEAREAILKKVAEKNIPVRKTREMVKLWQENPDTPIDQIVKNLDKKKVKVTRIIEKPGEKREVQQSFEVEEEDNLQGGNLHKKLPPDNPNIPVDLTSKSTENKDTVIQQVPFLKLKAALKILEMLELNSLKGKKDDVTGVLDRIEERVKAIRKQLS